MQNIETLLKQRKGWQTEITKSNVKWFYGVLTILSICARRMLAQRYIIEMANRIKNSPKGHFPSFYNVIEVFYSNEKVIDSTACSRYYIDIVGNTWFLNPIVSG